MTPGRKGLLNLSQLWFLYLENRCTYLEGLFLRIKGNTEWNVFSNEPGTNLKTFKKEIMVFKSCVNLYITHYALAAPS